MSERKLIHNAIYLTNTHKVYQLTSIDIQRFISMYMFPIEIIPPIAAVYLKEKHADVLQYLSEYILYNFSAPLDQPINKNELFNIIGKTITDTSTNIRELQEYDSDEVNEWHNAKLKEQANEQRR